MKYFFVPIFSILFFNTVNANNVNISDDINRVFKCKFDKLILKNQKFNYQTFLASEVNKKDLNNLIVNSIEPDILVIKGLSEFLTNNKNLEVKIVSDSVILFKAFNDERSYSESGIINRKSGELVHEITKNIESENSEKIISFYFCKNKDLNIL